MKRIVQFLLHFMALASALAVGGSQHQAHHRFHRHSLSKKAFFLEVITVCDLGGKILSQEECEAGIAAGRLKYANAPVITQTASSYPTGGPQHTTSSIGAKSTYITSVHSIAQSPSAASAHAALPSEAAPSSKAASSSDVVAAPSRLSAPSSVPGYSVKDVGRHFPNNIPCSEFPSDYGAVSIDYMNLGGWIGIQKPNIVGKAGFDDIETMVSDLCDGGDCCSEDSFCSYACPPGYQKAQWPTTQGATGQSIGGIQCRNGVLRLTNPDQPTLCMPGTDKVTVKVVNKLNGTSAVCRTDYPGTEAMTIPLETQPGEEYPLTCPDESVYYVWEGKTTSGQYYVNPLNVAVEDACVWSDGEQPIGNWAPLNLGVGYTNGAAWLAIFQNKPTTYDKLDFTVEIVADNMSGRCRYSNGEYCSGDNYEDCNMNDGCTVSVTSGEATFVFSH